MKFKLTTPMVEAGAFEIASYYGGDPKDKEAQARLIFEAMMLVAPETVPDRFEEWRQRVLTQWPGAKVSGYTSYSAAVADVGGSGPLPNVVKVASFESNFFEHVKVPE